MTIQRTNGDDSHFQLLASELESDLKIRDGDDHLLYAALNKTGKLEHAIVVYEHEKAIGCGALEVYAPDTLEMKRIFVRPADRRKGIASGILSHLEQWCLELGYRYCILETGRNQPEAMALYKTNGYELIPNFGKYIGSKNSICFKKDCSPAK